MVRSAISILCLSLLLAGSKSVENATAFRYLLAFASYNSGQTGDTAAWERVERWAS